MKSQPIILASVSPRRRALFKQLGLPFTVRCSPFEEVNPSHTRRPSAVVTHNALRKAQAVQEHYARGMIIGADTVVYQNGTVFGKPPTLACARRMILSLSRAPHWVYTGVAVLNAFTGDADVWYEKTKVFMRTLTPAEVAHYVNMTDPLDKAGGYAIQERGDLLISRIEGDFFNVVGLPLVRLDESLRIMLKQRNKRGR